ncbi:MAG: SDR family oxidoreductase [Candidatus Kapabacteria bacterium]|nr:SDR family oxidoreductase [Candidatus Kapabacteria bacterium]
MHSISIEGKVAIVTGAAGLLGKEFCLALANAGAHVIATDIEVERCSELIESFVPESRALRCNVTDYASVVALRNEVLSDFGSIDILVNNAAINDAVEAADKPAVEASQFEHYPYTLWERVMNVNVGGMFLCSQILGSAMLASSGGSIINIASTYGLVAPDQSIYHDGTEQRFFKSAVYPTSKAAVLGFTRFLAAYWAKHNIRVNALSPGGISNHQDEYFIRNYSERVPLGRMAEPHEYSDALLFLASNASSYMTGANLVIDGGWTAI